MKLGIMQPYFFPYLGHFDVINQTDRWVVLDATQYVPKSWMNRNRILHPTRGWQYMTVPVHHHDRCPINDVTLVDRDAACRRILGQIEHYRRGRAPFFGAVRELIESCFAGVEAETLVALNVRSLALTTSYLGIPFDYTVFSEADIVPTAGMVRGDWALEISTALGATEYINPPGGRGLFDAAEFAARGIRLAFTDMVDFRYPCGRYAFVEHLSIVDAMMWNPPEAIRAYLDAVSPARA